MNRNEPLNYHAQELPIYRTITKNAAKVFSS